MIKKIAWGTSKLLEMYLARTQTNPFSYIIDDFSKKTTLLGIPIKKSESLFEEQPDSFQIVIFAVSNRSLQEIAIKLNQLGLSYNKDFIFYSDFLYEGFLNKAEKYFGFKFDPKIYRLALSYTMNTRILTQTTILGTWMFLEILNKLNNTQGQIAEIGAFQGGNALCSLSFMTKLYSKSYYIFDSFEGFPELSIHDPQNIHKGDLKIETTFQEVLDTFSVFPEAIIIKGFVPDTFNEIPNDEKFSLIFYDCDLYKPALDTYEFFWDKIVPGGYLVIHDYETQEGGFTGVKKATDEFFQPKKIDVMSFYENTMAVIKKE